MTEDDRHQQVQDEAWDWLDGDRWYDRYAVKDARAVQLRRWNDPTICLGTAKRSTG